jgi:hypothetical protein
MPETASSTACFFIRVLTDGSEEHLKANDDKTKIYQIVSVNLIRRAFATFINNNIFIFFSWFCFLFGSVFGSAHGIREYARLTGEI